MDKNTLKRNGSRNEILCLGDIHFGHQGTSSQKLYYDLKEYFLPYVKNALLVVLVGDIFHTMLNLSSEHSRCATLFMIDLFKEVKKTDTPVRIVRGTYSHDRDQPQLFEGLGKKMGIDVKVYSSVVLEYIEKLDSHILFLPDNLPYKSSNEVLTLFDEKLKEIKKTSVDFCFGHGYFEHAFPPNVPKPDTVFSEKDFEDRVDFFTCFGHVHKPMQKGNIFYTGSFDRLCHGEEEKKGFLRFIINEDNSYCVDRVENEDACTFKTFYSKDTGEVLERNFKVFLEKNFKEGLSDQHLRLALPNRDDSQKLFSLCPKDFYLDVSFKSFEKREELDLDELSDSSISVVPTEENLTDLVCEYVFEKRGKQLDAKKVSEVLSWTKKDL